MFKLSFLGSRLWDESCVEKVSLGRVIKNNTYKRARERLKYDIYTWSPGELQSYYGNSEMTHLFETFHLREIVQGSVFYDQIFHLA